MKYFIHLQEFLHNSQQMPRGVLSVAYPTFLTSGLIGYEYKNNLPISIQARKNDQNEEGRTTTTEPTNGDNRTKRKPGADLALEKCNESPGFEKNFKK